MSSKDFTVEQLKKPEKTISNINWRKLITSDMAVLF
jgi:hypothetical protein